MKRTLLAALGTVALDWAMHARRALIASALASLAACASWLPKSHTLTLVSWTSFDEAKAAIDKIVPYQSRRAELAAQGIDPVENPAITILNYSDIAQRFAVGAIVGADQLDRGIRECLIAGKSCTGYQIAARRSNRNRVGNFWLTTRWAISGRLQSRDKCARNTCRSRSLQTSSARVAAASLLRWPCRLMMRCFSAHGYGPTFSISTS